MPLVRLAKRIETIPAHGLEMRTFIPGERVELSFISAQNRDVITIYDGHFKTPSTGFNTTKEAESFERAIYKDIVLISAPELGQHLLKIKGHSYDFQGRILYEGSGPDHAPLSGFLDKEIYLSSRVRGRSKGCYFIRTASPKPYQFAVGEKSYVLQTYKTAQGEEVFPDYFLVEQDQ